MKVARRVSDFFSLAPGLIATQGIPYTYPMHTISDHIDTMSDHMRLA